MISPAIPELRSKITELSVDSEKQELDTDRVMILANNINKEFLNDNVDYGRKIDFIRDVSN